MGGYVSKYTYESIFNNEYSKDDVNFDYVRPKGNRPIEFFWESILQAFDMKYSKIGMIYFFIYNSKEDEIYMKEFKDIFK